MTYMATPLFKNPFLGGGDVHEIYNFGWPFFINTIHLFVRNGEEDIFFIRNPSILHFLLQHYLPLQIYNYLSPYPTDATYQI